MRAKGRRRRRLRAVQLGLGALALAGLVGGGLLYRALRPTTYRPGETSEEITRKLSRPLPDEAPSPLFSDVTESAGLAGFRSFAGGRSSQLPEDMGSGLAWGDFDRDGDDDLFLVATGGALNADPSQWAPCVLYENLGDGSFAPVAGFPDLRIVGMGAAWGDADGDGWLDLAVAGYRTLHLLWNRAGSFEIGDALPRLDGYWAAPSWVDYDLDGDLDLYVTGYVQYEEPTPGAALKSTQQYGAAVPYTLNPASYDPERNLLFRNDGDGRFEEVAAELGVDNLAGRSLSALWHDLDDDGRPDLYVANDISDNAFFVNRIAGFSDSSLESWIADYRGAMGLAVGDWNRDGDDDLFVTHWLAQENALYDSLVADTAKEGQAPLLAFSDKAVPLGLGQIALSLVGWGVEFADFDGDGWLDLVVANGSTIENEETPKRLKPQNLLLMWSQQGQYFHDLAPASELLSRTAVRRGLAISDFDLDGDVDIAMIVLDGGVQLLRNEMQTGHWLELRLRDRNGGEAYGARVTVRAGQVEHRRSLTFASYLSQSSSALHFGLGAAQAVDAIEVRWPDGEIETYPGVSADTIYQLVRGRPAARPMEGPAGLSKRQRTTLFWESQRAAMDAVKREHDPRKAIPLFREALVLNPRHEDARYYLANCLAAESRIDEAIEELQTLQRLQPQSHRAFKRAATLRALTAGNPDDLAVAEREVRRALEINPEATGALLMLGEIELLRGRFAAADETFEKACRTNPRATGGFFLRAYIAWNGGDAETARHLLESARRSRGEDWKPQGAAAEGDVMQRMHSEASPLSQFWERWDGEPEPGTAFGPLDAYLDGWLNPSDAPRC